jgi:hypothetical protein
MKLTPETVIDHLRTLEQAASNEYYQMDSDEALALRTWLQEHDADLRVRLKAAERERDEAIERAHGVMAAVLHVLEGLGEARLHYPRAEEVLDVIGAELKDALFLAALTEEPKEATKPGHAHHDPDAIEYHTGVSNHSQPGAYRWSK